MGQTGSHQSNRGTILAYFSCLPGTGADIAKIMPTPDCWRDILAKRMKLKIAGLFRSLLGQGGNTEPVQPVAASRPPVAPPPLPAAYNESAPDAPHYASSYTPPPAPPQNSEFIAVPLAAVVNTLPMDLKAKMIEVPAPGKMIQLRVEGVIGQLAFGSVKITFGELRHLAPGSFVNSANAVFDSRQVALPLNEILSRINPTLLARRPASQKIEVSEEIAGPFGGHGRGVTFSAQPLKAPVAAPAGSARSVTPASPAPSPRETKPAAPINFAPTPPPVAPSAGIPPVFVSRQAPAAPPAPPAPPAAPPVTPPKSEPIAFSPRQNAPLVAPVPFADPASKPADNGAANGTGGSHGNGHGNGNGNGNGKSSAPLPAFKFTTAPGTPPVAPAAPAAAPVPPPEPPPSFLVPLKALAENWPSEIVTEMIQGGLVNASVPLPFSLVEPGLKLGRVTITWRDLRLLIRSDLPASLGDDLGLELPLKVVAPAFLAAQKKLSARSQSKVAVSEEIPNLFFGFPQPESAAPPATPVYRPAPLPQAPSPAAQTSIPASQNPQNPNVQKVTDTNLFSVGASAPAAEEESSLFQRTPAPATDFLSRQMQPKDVVAQAMTLPGVAGAVIALADGLRVASDVPAEFNPDTVAAFLPQIYERVNQSTRELRMGALNNVSFTVGTVPWKIFRVNSIYFAAFGRAGETFPKSQLAQLAAGLDRKSK
jgi:predicted regulator of Ras-like GTPase activity (Roadblock/LC7/MglB family)